MAETDEVCMIELRSFEAEELVNRLRGWGFIPKEGDYKCPQCECPLALQQQGRADGYLWVCNFVSIRKQKKQKCDKTVSFRTGTFFANSKLAIPQILGFIDLWVEKAHLALISKLAKMSLQSAVYWASFCREVLLDKYLMHPEMLGGPDSVVEIDESQFGRRKYHRGHRVEGQRVFGGYERGTGRVFMEVADNGSTDTLLPIIKKWIRPGTTIISDYWKEYNCLEREGYVQLKINHSINFVDLAKGSMSFSGRTKDQLPGNLARYMFSKSCAERRVNKTEEFYRIAALMYDPTKPDTQRDPEEVSDEYVDKIDN
ncbi:uncharacterized protein [Onthophagus taurus]|uniref:uncharacterized protein n=1 Tax=Onthophagus taurus TaxID=166361 RepID=UPI0039BE62DB